jgi:hypothetical protein
VPTFVATSPETVETWRFAVRTDYLPKTIDAIPSIVDHGDISFSPGRISLGGDLGLRAQLTVRFEDHRHIMAGESFTSGSFWRKWRARHGTKLRGRALRWITGQVGDALANMETRHFVIESTDGPTPGGVYTITAKDPLKLTDNDRAQAPAVSNGFLLSAITSTDTTATLGPAGIGNAEYAESGFLNIGGDEIVRFTRSGDNLTFVDESSPPMASTDGRGLFNTEAAAHDAEDRCQQVLRYSGEDPANIIRDLLINYADMPDAYIPLSSWLNETQTFLARLYTATIAEPTGVKDLISELIEQAGLAIWWDELEQLIRLQVLREVATNAHTWDEDNTVEGSLSSKEQPDKRVSRVLIYYAQKNPLKPLDETENYRSIYFDPQTVSEAAYGSASLKKIHSRWIPAFGSSNAEALSNLILSRFIDPPRQFKFSTVRGFGQTMPLLGTGYRLGSWAFQDEDGTQRTEPIQATRILPKPDGYDVEAEEMLFSGALSQDLTNRVILIDGNTLNFNLRTTHDTLYPEITGSESPAVTLTCIVQQGVIVGSAAATGPAFDVGSWPAGFVPHVTVLGRIQGAGGDGGDVVGLTAEGGEDGGTALYTRNAITLDDSAGEIWGGGGGGAATRVVTNGFGGGGGAGQIPGDGGLGNNGGDDGSPGTTEAGGAGGGTAGNGGDPGEAGGDSGVGTSGGAAGAAIDGISFVTTTGSPEGDRKGGQVN